AGLDAAMVPDIGGNAREHPGGVPAGAAVLRRAARGTAGAHGHAGWRCPAAWGRAAGLRPVANAKSRLAPALSFQWRAESPAIANPNRDARLTPVRGSSR